MIKRLVQVILAITVILVAGYIISLDIHEGYSFLVSWALGCAIVVACMAVILGISILVVMIPIYIYEYIKKGTF